MTVRSPYADRLATIPIVRRTVELSRGTTAYWEYGDADASTFHVLFSSALKPLSRDES